MPRPRKTDTHVYVCRKGHKYGSPMPLTFVSCGECNNDPKTRDNQNEMTEVTK